MIAAGEKPVVSIEDFNRISKIIPGFFCLDEQAQPVSCKTGRIEDKYLTDGKRNAYFETQSAHVSQLFRQEQVQKALAKTTVETIKINLDAYKLTPAQKEMVEALLVAGATMEELYHIQVGAMAHRDEVFKKGTPADKEFYNRYQTIWCDDPDPFCTPLPGLAARSNPLYPEGVRISCEDLKGDISNPFSAVAQENGKFKTVPYAQTPALAETQKRGSAELRAAASKTRLAGEGALADYILAVADALVSGKPFPYHMADKKWVAAKDSKFFLRIGADETQEDYPCMIHALYHMTLGIKNPASEKQMQALIAQKQGMEDYLAQHIPGYKPRKIELHTPEFMDVIMETGNARGAFKGTAAAQTLPNWCGEDGTAECETRAMVFTNKTKRSYSRALFAQLREILAPDVYAAFDTDEILNTIVLHEITHNLGPQVKDYQAKLTDRAMWIEEFKAELGAIALVPYLERVGLADLKNRNSTYAGLLGWSLGQIRRSAGRGEKFYETKSPYQQLAAVTVAYSTEKGAFTYANGRWGIVWDKAPKATENLFRDLTAVYVSGDRSKVNAFFEKYTRGCWQDLHLDRISETLAKVPHPLYRYLLSGRAKTKTAGK